MRSRRSSQRRGRPGTTPQWNRRSFLEILEGRALLSGSEWLAKFDNIPGNTRDQQLPYIQGLLHNAGLDTQHGINAVQHVGVDGVVIVDTSTPVDVSVIQEELQTVPGFSSVEPWDDANGPGSRQIYVPDSPFSEAEGQNPDMLSGGSSATNPPALLAQSTAGPSVVQVQAVNGFNGINDSQTAALSPPDSTGAVGPNSYIEPVNIALGIYDKTAGLPIPGGGITQFATFFSPLGTSGVNFSDPIVVYNEMTQRFAIGMLDFHTSGGSPTDSRLDFAISKTSNPTLAASDWNFFRYNTNDGIGASLDFSDYPKIGYNTDGYVVSFNMFPNSFDHVSVLGIANDGTSTGMRAMPGGFTNFTLAPASMHGAAPGAPMWFIGDGHTGNGGNTINVVRLDNPFSTAPVISTSFSMSVPSFGNAPNPRQPGGTLGGLDGYSDRTSLGTRFYFSGLRTVGGVTYLVSADAVGNGTGVEDRWYDFNVTSGTPVLVQQGTVNPNSSTTDTYFPDVDIGPDGSIGMNYSESGPSEYMSMYVTGRRPGDALGTMQTPVLAKTNPTGLHAFGRAGDYSFTTVDPTDGTFWAANEYAGSISTPNWATWIQHFTLGGLAVTASTPADGAVVSTPPSTYVISFSDAVDPTSLQPNDLTVNSIAADNVTLSADDKTAMFTYNVSPVTTQGLQSMSIAAGAVTKLGDSSATIAAFNAAFRYDAVLLQVSSTNPPPNGAFALPGPFTYDVTFNEPINPASVTTNSLVLSGIAGATVIGASVLPGNTTARFTIGGIATEGTLTANIAAGAVTDQYGNPGAAFSASYSTDIGAVPFPVPLSSVTPAGSLVYDPVASGLIGPSGDTDTFTLAIDPGQTISVLVAPTSPGLQPSVQLLDPSNAVMATATASGVGQDALIQATPTTGTTSGTYKIVVSGASATTGSYTVQAMLNAAQEEEGILAGATNNTIDTAQNIDGSFIGLGPAASRGAVLGQTEAGQNDWYSFNLTAGDTATLALKSLSTGTVNVTLVDPSGAVLAVGVAGPSNVDKIISDLVAPLSGTYFAVISGTASTNYSLTVLRNTAFELGNNSSLVGAQNIDGAKGALGHLGSGTSSGTVGYYTDSNSSSTGPEASIIEAGFTPIHIMQISTFDLNGVQILMVDESSNSGFSSDLLNSLSAIQTWVQTGGIFVVHDRFVGSGGNPLLIGAPGAVAHRDFTFGTDLNVIPPGGTLVTNGPFGTITDTTLDGGTSSDHGWVDRTSLPGGTMPILSAGPNANNVAALSYGLGGGTVYYSTIPLDYYLDGGGGGLATTMQRIYAPNVLAYAGSLETNPQDDWYSVSVNVGDSLVVQTSTPADGPGQFVNDLNPAIELYDPSNALVGSHVVLGDGRNEQIAFTATTAGLYRVRVLAEDTAKGDYFVSVNGATGTTGSAFQVTAINPPDGTLLRVAPTTITVDFNDAVYVPSVDASDLLIDGASTATGVTQIDGDTLAFTIPAGLSQGTHTLGLAAGSIVDVQQTPLGIFSSSFIVNSTGPRVTATSPAPNGVVAPGSLSYQVTFDKAMKVSNLSSDDFSLRGNILGVNYSASSFSFNPAGTVVTLNYVGLPEDNYTLTLVSGASDGSNFTDTTGNALDGEFSGTFPSGDGVVGGNFVIGFAMDPPGAEAYPVPLAPVAPSGSLIYDPSIARMISFVGDTDTFTLAIDPGQTISVLVAPTSPGLQPSVQLLDPSNAVIATATATGVGQDALIQATPTTGTTSGTYKIVVSGASATTGSYTLQATLNAAQEEEGILAGATNNTIDTAQNIDGSFLGLGPAASRGAVLGQTETGQNDWYSFNLTAGDTATLALKSLSTGTVNVTLVDPSGAVLAVGVAGPSNVDKIISDLVAPLSGTYFAVISGTASTNYSLTVLRNVSFDTEANDTIATAGAVQSAQPTGEQRVLGSVVSGVSDVFTLRGTPVSGSLILTGSKLTLGINADGSFITATGGTGIRFLGNEFVVEGTPLASFTISRSGSNFTNNAANGVSQIVITSLEDLSVGTRHGVRIVGTVGGNIQVERVVLFNDNDEFATVATRLTNLSNTALSGVASLENLDPDQGQPFTGDYSTYNDVVLGGQLVRADAKPAAFPGGLTIGLGSSDPRRVVSAGGFDNRDPFAIINSPMDPNGALADIAIALAFNYGSLAPFASTSSSFIMTFGRTTAEAEATYTANAGGTSIANSDVYQVNVPAAGTPLHFQTSTPGDGAGQPDNALDPKLRLLDAGGAVLAADDNGAADGRNAQLDFTAPAAGVYFIEVSSASASGEYVLSMSGNTPAPPPFQVTAINPPDGTLLRVAPTTITVDFNDAVYVPSVDASDLLIDGASTATGVTQIDGDTLAFTIPAGLSQGTHTLGLAAGSIVDVQQTPLGIFSSSFIVNSTGPRVTATSPAPNGVVAPGSLSYQVTFDKAMKVSNLSSDDFSLRGNILGVNYSASSFSFNPAGTVVTLNYVGLPEDNYTLTLVSGASDGSNFTDTTGNALDGEFSGTFPSGDGVVGGNFVIGFAMDPPGAEAYPVPLAPVAPSGSLIYDPSIARMISFVGDTDTFTLAIDPGQTISVLVAPTSPGLQPSVQLLDPSNAVIATATATGVGQDALIQATPTTGTTSGTYKIVVSGASATTGSYTLQATLNAAQEEEGILAGATNNTIDTAQNIDGSFLGLGGAASRGAVLGTTDVPLTFDFYSFSLNAGETTTLALKSLTAANLNLVLQDSTGATLATGVAGATNLNRAISNFVAPATATYYARVSGDGGVNYSLVATGNIAFDTESNDTFATAQTLDGVQGALGSAAISSGAPLDSFDQGPSDLGNYTFVSTNGATITAAAAHDGPFGLQLNGEWMYRNDASAHVAQGNVLSVWVQSAGSIGSGRAYFGFGATATGTLAMVMGDNTNSLIIQRNANYGFTDLASVPQTWLANHWYRFEVTWQTGGNIIGRLYDSNGTTLLNTVTATDTTITSGGIAFRAFGNNRYFDTAGGGSFSDQDWYSITTTAAANELKLATNTPADGPGEFANTLTPKIEVYDPSNVLVASGTVGADGRNESLQYVAPLPGVYRVHVLAQPNTQGEYFLSSQLGHVSTIQTVTIDDGTAQRSRVRSIAVDFNGNITTAPSSAFRLVRTEGGLSVPVIASAPTPLGGGTSRVTLTFSGPSLDFGSLSDGHYTLSIDGSQIIDDTGRQVGAGTDRTPGSTGTVQFFRFFGDANGDGLVDASDYLAFRAAYLSGNATGANSIFDFNGDGVFSSADLQAFTNNFTKRQLTTTTLTADRLAGSTYGESVTFTANVNAADNVSSPTGDVQFVVDGSNFGQPVGLVDGAAAIGISSLSVGSHLISAVYTSDSFRFADSSSAPLTQIVDPASTVVGRFLFYNGSSRYDTTGNPQTPLPFSDDNAIAVDKAAYLPGSGTTTFANVSSYTLGINGLMVDVSGTHGTITANDFIFKTGNNNSPSSWTTVAAPATVRTRLAGSLGLAPGGPDRVEITFPDNAIQKTWLEVIVKGNDALGGNDTNTGLAASNVFFWGNALADDGLTPDDAAAYRTSANDELDARNNPKTLIANIPITNLQDYNRDGLVSATDQLFSRNNPTTNIGGPHILNIAGGGPFAPDAAPAVAPAASSTTAPMASMSSATAPLASGLSLLGSLPPSLPSGLQSRLESILDGPPVVTILHTLEQRDSSVSRQILQAIDQITDKYNLHDDVLDGILVELGLE